MGRKPVFIRFLRIAQKKLAKKTRIYRLAMQTTTFWRLRSSTIAGAEGSFGLAAEEASADRGFCGPGLFRSYCRHRAVFYRPSADGSKLRCPFLSDRYFFIVVRLLGRREKFTEPDFALLARAFKRAPMGLRPTQGDEDTQGRHPREKLALSLSKGGGPRREEGGGFPPFDKLRASFSRE